MLWNKLFHVLYIFTVPFIIVHKSAANSDSSEETELEVRTEMDSSDEDHSCTRLYKRCIRQGPHWQQVCGTDGKTYSHICRLYYTNCWIYDDRVLRKAYDGPCIKPARPRPPTRPAPPLTPAPRPPIGTLAPPTMRPTIFIGPTVVDGGGGALPGIVGGVGNPTNNAPTSPCSQYCPLESDPVCGTDGNTYISPCLLEVQACVKKDPGLKIWYKGVCDDKTPKLNPGTDRPCPRLETCPLIYLPVCGSDGTTYQTECHLLAKACSSQNPADTNLQVLFVGECADRNTPSNCGSCSEVWQPVCGMDNVTYYSECHLRQYACENSLIYLRVAYRSICKAGLIECPDYCPIGVNDPVCGTDGNTYPSLCFLSYAACLNNDHRLTLKHRGECSTDPCERKCPEDAYQPVCSSAGDTYQNDCFLWVAMCRDSTLSRASPNDVRCNFAIP